MDMTMDVYGDNEVNDLKELWETDLDVSGKKKNIILIYSKKKSHLEEDIKLLNLCRRLSFARGFFDVIKMFIRKVNSKHPYLTLGEKEFSSVT